MKQLTVTYDGRQLVDLEVAEMTLTENDDGITVKARTAPRTTPLVGLLQTVSSSRRSSPRRGIVPALSNGQTVDD